MTDLSCNRCGKHMGTLRDARIRDGMTVYCIKCSEYLLSLEKQAKSDVPDFFKGIFK